MTVGDLKKANPDLKLKSLENRATELYGMSMGQYFKTIGILGDAPKKTVDPELQERKRQSEEEELKKYDAYCQANYIGWKSIPTSLDDLYVDNRSFMSRIEVGILIDVLNIDAEQHFRDVGVLANEMNANELRDLIGRYIDFSVL